MAILNGYKESFSFWVKQITNKFMVTNNKNSCNISIDNNNITYDA